MLEPTLEQALSDLEAAKARVVELEAALNVDQSGLAHGLSRVLQHVQGWGWVIEGRGPYEWDDEGYRREFGYCLQHIETTARMTLLKSDRLAGAILRREPVPSMEEATFYHELRRAVDALKITADDVSDERESRDMLTKYITVGEAARIYELMHHPFCFTAELFDEAEWNRRFSESKDVLAAMANQAIANRNKAAARKD
jgi:hypothetical protein